MKKILLTLVILLNTVCGYSQNVVFDKFELKWFSVMGVRSDDGQSLNLTLKNTSDKVIKYVTVYYNVMNDVGDFVKDNLQRTDFSVNCTGPFLTNKKYKLYVKIAVFFPKLLKAVPSKIVIQYMNDTEEEIEINTENMKLYFSKMK